MPMGLLTSLKILQTIVAYLFVTIVIPGAVLKRKLEHYRFAKRILLLYIIGNFYIVNLVFTLQLLHISNFFTIWAGLIVVPAVAWAIIYKFPLLSKIKSFSHASRKVISGTLGFKSIINRVWYSIKPRLVRILKALKDNLLKNLLDWILIAILVVLILYVYGTNTVTRFGFSASDIPVHLYWTNSLIDNNVFVAGIYPEGMHCIIYLIGVAFHIDIYVIFRVFGLIQTIAIHLMPLVFLKLCCKSRFAPYPGVFLYIIGDYMITTYLFRYLSALPQEFSMIFIFPTAYFAMSFFAQKKREIEENSQGKDSVWSLAGLIMSFALAVSTHFYGAIIAGLFCFGIAVGYIRWIIKPVYLKRIVIAGLISLFIAILPMAIAFIGGTPLQGSLGWATEVITDSIKSNKEQEASTEQETLTEQEALTEQDPSSDTSEENPVTTQTSPEAAGEATQAKRPGLISKLLRLPVNLWDGTGSRLQNYILRYDFWWCSLVFRLMIVFLIIAGVLFMLFTPSKTYGAVLASTGAFMVFMSLMFSATYIGIPALVGANRTCIFYAYSLSIVVGLSIDVCVYLLTCIFRVRWPMHILSFAITLLVGIYIFRNGYIREPITYNIFETNEAITCLTNIIATEQDYKWTIFSANDETNMVNGHGYHYEPITFLREIRYLWQKPVTVPTDVVYFYIEKIPLDYAVAYSGSGQMVSEEGAMEPIPFGKGLSIYQGRNRWIVMSHMYYWAQEFQRLYPNEMKVYMETDSFICYRLEQNPYRLFDLSIDYGYNNGRLEESAEESMNESADESIVEE